MRRPWPPCLLLVLLAACGGRPSIPAVELSLSVTSETNTVVPGRSFEVTVVRVWQRSLIPDAWVDDALSPLVVRLERSRTREQAGRVEETFVYAAYVFALDDVTVAPPAFMARPRDGGPDRVAACPPLRLIVVPALDPAAPGPAEKPPGPLESPPARLRWWVIVLAVGGAAAVIGWWWRTRQPAPPPPTPPARAGAGARARLRLRWLQERLAVDAEIESWFHVELSSLLRDYVADRFGVNAPSLSTQEFLGGIESQRALEPAHLALLEDVFLTCDAVKFAGGRATQAERRRLLADAEGFVRETAEDPGPDPPVSGGEATP